MAPLSRLKCDKEPLMGEAGADKSAIKKSKKNVLRVKNDRTALGKYLIDLKVNYTCFGRSFYNFTSSITWGCPGEIGLADSSKGIFDIQRTASNR